MPSSLPGLFGAIALAAAGFPLAPSNTVLWLPACHGSAVPISLPGKNERGPSKSCPGGCHAACMTREDDPGEETEDA